MKENANDPEKSIKSIYKTLNDTFGKQKYDLGNSKTNDDIKIANGFCKFFTTIIIKMKSKAMPLVGLIWKCPCYIRKRACHLFRFEHVVQKLLREIKRKNSTGIDSLPANLLKNLASAIAEPLSFIINMSLDTWFGFE